MRSFLAAVALGLVIGIDVQAAEGWKPGAGPLMTRWAKDVSPEKVHPEYPRPQMVREKWMNLNGLWQITETKEGEQPPVGKELSGRILVPFPVESALSGVMKPWRQVAYRRSFTLPTAWKGERVLLHFGAVNWESKVFLNGKELGSHSGGYDGFSFDITDGLKGTGEQELIVTAWNPADSGSQPRGKQVLKPGGIYYTPSTGIWQTVWLEPVPKGAIEGLKIVPDLGEASVDVLVNVKGAERGDEVVLSVPGARDTSDNLLTFPGKPAEATGGAGQYITVKVPVVYSWTPEAPWLYPLRVELRRNGKTVDKVESYFALRSMALGKDEKGITRLMLNGKPVFQVGPLDQGFWPDGLYTAPTDAALKYDIEITKQLGFNMARKHVKVEPERWYYWCDKLGLLVWQDMPSGDKSVAPGKGEITRTPEAAKQFELELKRMIDGRHNHPCIVMWVVFNEGWGQYDTVRLTKWTKEYDPTRIANCASGWNDFPAGDVHDIHVYPGPGSPKPEENRAAVLGEYGGLGLPIEKHLWTNESWGYRGMKDAAELQRKYESMMRKVYQLKENPGMSAAIYTQTTDVETEANGLLTYDRAVLKVDLKRTAAVNKGDFSLVPEYVEIVPTAEKQAIAWRYTLEKPAEGWFKPDFDESGWMQGPGGFGTKMTPGTTVRTEWKTSDIWIRREFELPERKLRDPLLWMHHDEDAEVYLNGVLAAKVTGYTVEYDAVSVSKEAAATLKPGKNVIAIHCKQTGGGQYIDAGIVDLK